MVAMDNRYGIVSAGDPGPEAEALAEMSPRRAPVTPGFRLPSLS